MLGRCRHDGGCCSVRDGLIADLAPRRGGARRVGPGIELGESADKGTQEAGRDLALARRTG